MFKRIYKIVNPTLTCPSKAAEEVFPTEMVQLPAETDFEATVTVPVEPAATPRLAAELVTALPFLIFSIPWPYCPMC